MASEFLDLVHHYIFALTEKPEDRQRLDNLFIGPPRVDRPSVRDERTGMIPPAWWRGDEYASRSGIAAAATMRR